MVMVAFEKALELNNNCIEAIEGCTIFEIHSHSDPEETLHRAVGDLEVQRIHNYHGMRMILEQMSSNPQEISEHLKNLEMAEKFMKL